MCIIEVLVFGFVTAPVARDDCCVIITRIISTITHRQVIITCLNYFMLILSTTYTHINACCGPNVTHIWFHTSFTCVLITDITTMLPTITVIHEYVVPVGELWLLVVISCNKSYVVYYGVQSLWQLVILLELLEVLATSASSTTLSLCRGALVRWKVHAHIWSEQLLKGYLGCHG